MRRGTALLVTGVLLAGCSSDKESGEELQVAHTVLLDGTDSGLYIRDTAKESGAEHRLGSPLKIGTKLLGICVEVGIDPYQGAESNVSLAEELKDPPKHFDELSKTWVKINTDDEKGVFAHAAYLEPYATVKLLPRC